MLWLFPSNLLAIVHTGSYASPGGHCSEVLQMGHALSYSSGPFFFLWPSHTEVLLVVEPGLPWVAAAGNMLEFKPSMCTGTWPDVSLTLLTSSSRSSSAARPAHRDFAILCYCFMTLMDQLWGIGSDLEFREGKSLISAYVWWSSMVLLCASEKLCLEVCLFKWSFSWPGFDHVTAWRTGFGLDSSF